MTNWMLSFEIQANAHSGKAAIISSEGAKSYAELHREASAFANWLGAHSVTRVAMYLPNCPGFFVAELGALKAGAVGVPINYMFGRDLIEYVLGDSAAEVLVASSDDIERLNLGALAGDAHLRYLVSLTPSSDTPLNLKEMISSGPSTAPTAPRADDDLFNITYTSGTTGRPKGVMKTHRNMTSQMTSLIHNYRMTPDSRWLCAGPVYHTSGLESSSLPVLTAGGTVVLIKWNCGDFFEYVQRNKTDVAWVAGSMLIDIADYTDRQRWDFSSLRYLVGGGAAVSDEVCERIERAYGFRVTERLGMTEAGAVFAYPVDGERTYRVRGSCGRFLHHHLRYRLAHPVSGAVLESRPGEPARGELQLHGDGLFVGYLNLPDKTNQSFTEDGWYRSGDLVEFDADGYAYHQRRRDEIIITGGENVSPRSVENVIAMHPGVREVAVFALPSPRWGQQVCAAVVTAPDSGLTETALIDHCKRSSRLARFEVPKRVFFRDDLPKTPTMSIPREKLTEYYASNTTSLGGEMKETKI